MVTKKIFKSVKEAKKKGFIPPYRGHKQYNFISNNIPNKYIESMSILNKHLKDKLSSVDIKGSMRKKGFKPILGAIINNNKSEYLLKFIDSKNKLVKIYYFTFIINSPHDKRKGNKIIYSTTKAKALKGLRKEFPILMREKYVYINKGDKQYSNHLLSSLKCREVKYLTEVA